jgi:hypothetical protein
MAGPIRHKTQGIMILLLLLGLLPAVPAVAARLHISLGGLRTSGPSLDGDWSAANCYQDLESAALQAAAGDTLLLDRQSHHLNSTIVLPGMLGNRNLDIANTGTQVACQTDARILLHPDVSHFQVTGLQFTGDRKDSDHSLFSLENPAGQLIRCSFSFCNFTDLTASELGGGGSCIQAIGDGNGALIVIENSFFAHNVSRGGGGVMQIQDGYDLRIDKSIFLDNTSRDGPVEILGAGGALYVKSATSRTTVLLRDSFFHENSAWGPGGAIYQDDASLTIQRCNFTGNVSAVDGTSTWAAGAGILMKRTGEHVQTVALIVEQSEFTGNQGDISLSPWAGDGGGILVQGMTNRLVNVAISDCLFRENFNAQGAGLYMGRFAVGKVTRCRFLDNTAYLQGGASFKGGALPECLGETAVYEYCEFTGNQAGKTADGLINNLGGFGGALATRYYPRIEVYNCTFFNNSTYDAQPKGNAFFQTSENRVFTSDLQRCKIVNSVFYGDIGAAAQIHSPEGGFSLISDCAYAAGQLDCKNFTPTAITTLLELPFNTIYDLTPHAESPLLDAAQILPASLDVLKNEVPVGDGPDIGAYERQIITDLSRVPRSPGFDLDAWPNPFNPSCRIRYELPAPAMVRLDIFDTRGRRLVGLVSEMQGQGSHETSWTALAADGRAVASGTYIARLMVNDRIATIRLSLIR